MEKPKSSDKPRPMPPSPEERRGFFVRAAALVIGGIVTLFPFAAGLAVFLDPLRRPSAKAKPIKVADLDVVPDDGRPYSFPVIADLEDAWNRYPEQPIGTVYLIRQPGQTKVVAFNAMCPHARGQIGFVPEEGEFRCPIHGSTFKLDGTRTSEDSYSPRDMDSLPCDVKKDGGVWVAFQNFRAGVPESEKIAP
jgi:menaquinol-cytochrome c reductase iron-sulfur subunit